MSNFAWIRHARYKGSHGSHGGYAVTEFWDHALRLIPQKHVDPALTDSNLYFGVETNGRPVTFGQLRKTHPQLFTHDYLRAQIHDHLKKFGIKKPRRDAVWCEELLQQASPEVFRGGLATGNWDHDVVRKFYLDTIEFNRKKFGDHFLFSVYHIDELTPHVSTGIVPLLEKTVQNTGRVKKKTARTETHRWCLSARDLFSKKACSDNQTEYAAFLQKRGHKVQRGIFNSKASHIVMKGHVARVLNSAPALPVLALPEPGTGLRGLAQSKEDYRALLLGKVALYVREVEEVVGSYHAKAIEFDSILLLKNQYHQAAKRKETAYEKVAMELQQAKAHSDGLSALLRERTQSVAELTEKLNQRNVPVPIEQALGRLLRRQISFGPSRVGLPGGRRVQLGPEPQAFEITGKESQRRRGNGTIDLVCSITGWCEANTLQWLEKEFGPDATLASQREHWNVPQTVGDAPGLDFLQDLSRESTETWPLVRESLIKKFHFGPHVIDALAAKQLIGSNGGGDLLIYRPGQDQDKQPIYVRSLGEPVFTQKLTDQLPVLALGTGRETVLVTEDPLNVLALHGLLHSHQQKWTFIATGYPVGPDVSERLAGIYPDVSLLAPTVATVLEFASQETPDADIGRAKRFQSWLDAWISFTSGDPTALGLRRSLVQMIERGGRPTLPTKPEEDDDMPL